ncbi:MAG: aminopeptidase N, partial [Aestuariivirga sp.]
QCEAEGFRRITYFYDRPDVLAVYRVRIEADKTLPVLLSNGNPQTRGPMAGTDFHFAEWHDPHPKPSYLFALVSGNLAKVESRFTTMEGRDVALGIYVEQGKQDRCAWAMQSLKTAMKWDEEAFARAYDLDVFNIVAVSDFNMGAMENKGLNVFNDKYILARADTATDTDFELIEAIIAHEYFHNWTGNRITCRDWFQLCLKEGLTVFRDQEFTSDLRSRAVKRIDDVQDVRARQMPEDAGPLQHPPRPSEYIEINNFYTATVYEKGAEICRMLKTLVGEKAFARGMQLYFRRHDGQAATVEQFIACFAQASRKNLSQFLRWYEQAGTPLISLKEKYDAKNHAYHLTVSQKVKRRKGQQPKKPLHMPLHIGLLQKSGKEISKTLELKKATQVFTIKNVGTKPVLSFNRAFSSAIVNTYQPKLADQLFLLAHDSDSFNRWEQAQSIAQHLIIERYRHGDSAKWKSGVEAFTQALRAPLLDEKLEAAYRAKLLELPELNSLAESLGKDVDATKLENAQHKLRCAIGVPLATEFESLYHALAVSGSYSPDPDSNGRRALRSAILSMAADAKATWAPEALRQQFAAHSNMTEEYAALRVAANMGGSLGDEFIATFYDRHQNDPLLMDKWFAAQALIPGVESAKRVRKLMGQQAFNF